MRITRVRVDGLFGVFDHDVPLNDAERVTIMYGPNGYGKTMLLRLVDAVFNNRNSVLLSIPFKSVTVEFDRPRTSLVVSRAADGKEATERVSFALKRPGRALPEYTVPHIDAARAGLPLDYVESLIPGLDRVTRTSWRYLPTGEILGVDEVIDRFADEMGPIVREFRLERRPKWLDELRDEVRVRLIDTLRLQQRSPTPRRPRDLEAQRIVPAVAAYADDLAKLIQAKLAESATLSQSLDRSFPARVVAAVGEGVARDVSDEQLRDELAKLERRRSDLREAGLLDTEMASEFQVPHALDESTKAILSVYVQDVKQKLSVFDDLAARTDLFKRIVNARFQYKEMVVSRDEGYAFRAPNGARLLPQHLSSGEQHEVVLLYDLLFKVSAPSLILIDEPELSLHVAWQQAFLRDLQDVARLGDFDVLLATHSPQIISDRFDLTVELHGPAKTDAGNR